MPTPVGIAHNKTLAKLACDMHKPNQQTTIPHSSVGPLFRDLPVQKVRGLGRKLGDDLVEKGIVAIGDLLWYVDLFSSQL